MQIEFDTAVSRHLRQRQLIETGEQQLHVRQEGVQSNGVVGAQGGIQAAVQTCVLVDVVVRVRPLLRLKLDYVEESNNVVVSMIWLSKPDGMCFTVSQQGS